MPQIEDCVAYRHWPEWVAKVAQDEGCVRLALATSYRATELLKIQDDMEGQVVGTGDFYIDEAREGDADIAALKSHGLDIGPASKGLTVTGNKFITKLPPFYVICFSLDDELGKFDEAGRSANIVTRINSMRVLTQALTLALSHCHHTTGPALLGRVDYVDRSYDIRNDRLNPDPFKKPTKFSSDKEVRIIIPARAEAPQHLHVVSRKLSHAMFG